MTSVLFSHACVMCVCVGGKGVCECVHVCVHMCVDILVCVGARMCVEAKANMLVFLRLSLLYLLKEGLSVELGTH